VSKAQQIRGPGISNEYVVKQASMSTTKFAIKVALKVVGKFAIKVLQIFNEILLNEIYSKIHGQLAYTL
jgi:hypothetical protein